MMFIDKINYSFHNLRIMFFSIFYNAMLYNLLLNIEIIMKLVRNPTVLPFLRKRTKNRENVRLYRCCLVKKKLFENDYSGRHPINVFMLTAVVTAQQQ
jgi:hypothetical protein